MGHFSDQQDFNALSVFDLLAAREQFHFHLMHKPNVVGTAIGRYRIRKTDPYPTDTAPHVDTIATAPKPKRTLYSSEVRDYSWPSILVFVRQWIDNDEFVHPEDAIPKAVFLANGKRVPICVIEAALDERLPDNVGRQLFPGSVLGGGYPVLCEVQGKQHFASVGCLVTDGHNTYALTNRHVAGAAGEPLYSMLAGNRERVGVSASLSLTRKLFTDLYPSWPGKDTYVDLDVGLIAVDDVHRWTTQVYGIGQIGPLADLDISNLTLHIIGCPVRAHGSASGDMRGEVCAMFYRFKAVGGFEYVADLLIGPRGAAPLGTRPGDSGTLWVVDDPGTDDDKAALALQWGGQVFEWGGGVQQASSYALATLLSTVCRELDVDLVRDWNIGLPDYWGAVGHYGIASKAIDALPAGKLKTLMSANLKRISYDVADINKKNLQGLSKLDFVPLADVPDMVWKVGPHKRGGMKSPEHANHFADMDRELDPPLAEGATLLKICDDPDNVKVAVWKRYYDAVKKQFPAEEESRGLLPFRVWQIYQSMVESVGNGDVDNFLCAAGILSHYVGDSCQPLHISYLFNGDPERPVAGMVKDPHGGQKPGMVPFAKGVHAVYEEDMVDRHVDDVFAGIDNLLQTTALPATVTGGHAAAVAVVRLMQATFRVIPPMSIVDAYATTDGDKPAPRADALWDEFGEGTVKVMTGGALTLAQLWLSAWKEGGGDAKITKLTAVDEATLAAIYQDPAFLPSKTLNTIGPLLH